MEFEGKIDKTARKEYINFFISRRLILVSITVILLLVVSIIGRTMEQSALYNFGIIFAIIILVLCLALRIYANFAIKKLFNIKPDVNRYKAKIEKDKIYMENFSNETLVNKKEILNFNVFRVFETRRAYIFLLSSKVLYVFQKTANANVKEINEYFKSVYENRFEPLHKKRLIKRR